MTDNRLRFELVERAATNGQKLRHLWMPISHDLHPMFY